MHEPFAHPYCLTVNPARSFSSYSATNRTWPDHQPRNPGILSVFPQNPGICTVLATSPATQRYFPHFCRILEYVLSSVHQPRNPEILSAFLQNPGICTVHQPRNPEILSAFLQNPGICTYYCTVQQPRNPGCFPHFCRSMVLTRQTSSKTLDTFRISAEATSA